MTSPWSFTTWLSKGKKIGSYWVGTSSVEALVDELAPHLKDIFTEVCKFSFDYEHGKRIENITPNICYDGINLKHRDVWNLLIQTGYLSFIPDNAESKTGRAILPNKELHLFWKDEFLPMVVRSVVPDQERVALVEALKSFNVRQIREALENSFMKPSCFDLSSEARYRVLLLGIFFGIGLKTHRLSVSSNCKTGYGGYDLAIEFTKEQGTKKRKVIIFEFKKSSSAARLEADAKRGLKQILDKKYMAGFEKSTFLLIGVSFYRKKMSLQTKRVP